MPYSLDSNACVEHLRGVRKGNPSPVSVRLASERQEDVWICTIVRGELLYGAEKSSRPTLHLAETRRLLSQFPSVAFDDAAADAYGRIRADLERRGVPIDANDLLIAAIAIANDLTLVTHNTAEFSRVSGLNLEDWQ